MALAAGLALSPPLFAHPTADLRLAELNRAIASRPDDARLYLRRGEVHRLQRSWAMSEADYLRCRRLDPDLVVVDFLLGRMLFEAGRTDEAVAVLDRFLARRSDDPRALALRGRVRSASGDHAAAARDLDRAIVLYVRRDRSPAPELFLDRARALMAAGAGQIERALRGLDEGLELLHRPVTLELAALELESSSGRFDAALRRIDRRLAGRPESTAWRMRRGAVLERAGRRGEARAEYLRVLAGLDDLPSRRRALPGPARQRAEARAALLRIDGGPGQADGAGP